MCQCNNKKDPHVFLYSDAVGSFPDKRCPECGFGFFFIDPPSWMDKYLYVNNDVKYYEY